MNGTTAQVVMCRRTCRGEKLTRAPAGASEPGDIAAVHHHRWPTGSSVTRQKKQQTANNEGLELNGIPTPAREAVLCHAVHWRTFTGSVERAVSSPASSVIVKDRLRTSCLEAGKVELLRTEQHCGQMERGKADATDLRSSHGTRHPLDDQRRHSTAGDVFRLDNHEVLGLLQSSDHPENSVKRSFPRMSGTLVGWRSWLAHNGWTARNSTNCIQRKSLHGKSRRPVVRRGMSAGEPGGRTHKHQLTRDVHAQPTELDSR